MGTLEKILLVVFALVVVYCLYKAFFSKKKKGKEKPTKEKKSKKDKKEESLLGDKKVEKVFNPKQEETPSVQMQTEGKEKTLEKEPPKEKIGFKIIRKQSNIKINKKALNANSRNPSITKVFDSKGKKIEEEKPNIEGSVLDENIGTEANKYLGENEQAGVVMSDIASENIGAFGVREQTIDAVSSDKEFKINVPIGSPNRAPIIGDRTNFGSHLNVSEDGNLSGVVGTGVAKIIDQAEQQATDIDKKTTDMLENIRRNILGDRASSFGMYGQYSEPQQQKVKNKFKDIDAKTLIIAEALNNPKGKRPNKN